MIKYVANAIEIVDRAQYANENCLTPLMICANAGDTVWSLIDPSGWVSPLPDLHDH